MYNIGTVVWIRVVKKSIGLRYIGPARIIGYQNVKMNIDFTFIGLYDVKLPINPFQNKIPSEYYDNTLNIREDEILDVIT